MQPAPPLHPLEQSTRPATCPCPIPVMSSRTGTGATGLQKTSSTPCLHHLSTRGAARDPLPACSYFCSWAAPRRFYGEKLAAPQPGRQLTRPHHTHHTRQKMVMGRSARGVAFCTNENTHGTKGVEVPSFATQSHTGLAVAHQSA